MNKALMLLEVDLLSRNKKYKVDPKIEVNAQADSVQT